MLYLNFLLQKRIFALSGLKERDKAYHLSCCLFVICALVIKFESGLVGK